MLAAVAMVLLGVLVRLLSRRRARSGRRPSGERRDHDRLIHLRLKGSYREMGLQQARLLGPVVRDVYRLQRADYAAELEDGTPSERLFDRLGVPALAAFGGLFDDSGLTEEVAGLAEGLGVSRADLMRSLLSLGGGSTVFAATRDATQDGRAIIGRNVDWEDRLGRLRPVVLHYRPTNGDLEHLVVGWPLCGLPAAGLNEAGFALSFNYFESDPRVAKSFPQWPHRRALQSAETVEDGLRAFREARVRGIATFMVMADAHGDIAMIECVPDGYEVYRPNGDWFAQANHARTPGMVPYDRGRSPDSFRRLEDMERAVRDRLGEISPGTAAAILRDRTGHPYPNSSCVANARVLNALVIHPASLTLWHSTTLQPQAPFGRYVPFTLGGRSELAPIPEAPALGGDDMKQEAAAMALGRRAMAAHKGGRWREACDFWDAIASLDPPRLDPARVAVGRAYAHARRGDPEGARRAASPAIEECAPFDARAYGLVTRGLIADRLGRRADALGDYQAATAHISSRPELNSLDALERLAAEGLRTPQARTALPVPGWDVLGLPR